MKDCRQFYIDGKWVDPAEAHDFTVINPATEEPIATISLGSSTDVDRAVAAAKRAFESYSETTPGERLALLRRVIEVYQSKMDEMADTISQEMGAPISLSRKAQAPAGLAHLAEIVKVLDHFKFEETQGFDAHAKRADWSVRTHHPVELADEPDRAAKWRPHSRRGARWFSSLAKWLHSPRICSRRFSMKRPFLPVFSTW